MEFRLKKLRKERKISQLKLAMDVNMNQNTISRYENLEREADYETLIKFADYFGVSIDRVLADEQKEKPGQIPLAELSEEKQQLIKVILEMTDERAAALHRALNE